MTRYTALYRYDNDNYRLAHGQYLTVFTLTNALALVIAIQLAGLSSDTDPIRAMFTLTLLVGVIMSLLGLLNLGSVIRFVSKEVMSGFVCATAVVGLAEASGAGAAYPNEDGSKSDMSRDFSVPGLGNVIGSFFNYSLT